MMKWFSCFVLCISLGLSSCTLSCPDPGDILPCTCTHHEGFDQTYIYCEDATDESEIEEAFLASFPVNDLYLFNLRNNHDIRVLTHSLFNGVTFNRMVLDQNDIIHINETFFEGQKETLRQIFAYKNRFGNEGFPYSVLPSLPNLDLLHLDRNGISSLPDPIPPNKITSMNYADNFIDTFEEGTFQNCKELKFLYLSYNSIRSIPPGKELYLKYFNNIKTSFISGAFNGADSLYSIDLHKNGLTSIPEGTFADLVSLYVIDLYDNPIHSLGIGK